MADALTIAGPAAQAGSKRDFHLIPAFDADAGVMAYVETPRGRLLLFATMLVLATGDFALMAMIGFGAVVAYVPRHRAALMTMGSVALCLFGSMLAGGARPSAATALGTFGLFAFTATLLAVARRVGRRGPFARPVSTLFVVVAALAALGSLRGLGPTAHAIMWAATTTLAGSMWFIAYGLGNVTGRKAQPIARHLGALHPFWGSTTVPFGKGAAYLVKFEARDETELAVTQIKAAKLMLWAKVLLLAETVFDALVHTGAGVPQLDAAIAALAAGHPWSRTYSIAAIPINFIDCLFWPAVVGNVFVACCRYAGFRIPRNMCRPLEARSIADFWNRYYYYYKELLVDVFFLPTFSRLQGWPVRVRMFAATFFAAGVGNYLFHFFRDIDQVRTLGPMQAIIGSQTFAFYCVLLPLGITCSQLCGATPVPAQGWNFGRTVALGRVIAFYCLVSLFAYTDRTLTLLDHFHFIVYVLGIAS